MGIVFKLVETNGLAKLKFSEDIIKSTLPGRKIVYRVWVESQTTPIADVIALPDEHIDGTSKIKVVSLTKTSERYTIIPKKVKKILHLVWDKGNIVSPVFDLNVKIYKGLSIKKLLLILLNASCILIRNLKST